MKVHLPPGIADKYKASLDRVVRNCPAYGTLRQTPELDLELVWPEASAENPSEYAA
ncbi:MAG TPA: hypothetical protein VHM70_32620 [Polyangiaceae bacterium]|nr:hypothetical protein [Polyangiaceae bacterium]